MCRKVYNLLVLVFPFFLMSPIYSEELVLDSDLSLLDVFESGFRPRNVAGLEKSICQTENTGISLAFSNGEKLEFYAERVSFTVNRENIVVQLRASSPPINTREAKQILAPFLAENSSRSSDFETYLAGVESNALNAYDGYGFTFEPNSNVKATLGFVAGNTSTDTPLRFVCTVQWSVKNSRADRRDSVIRPPAGFEDHSMEPEGPTLSRARDAGDPTISGEEPKVAKEREEVLLEDESEGESRSLSIWALALIVVAVLGILFLLIRAVLRGRAS